MNSKAFQTFTKLLFLASGSIMFMLLGSTALIYQNEIKAVFVKSENKDTLVKIQALGAIKSEGSEVKGDAFFSEEELKELIKDTSVVKIETKEK